MSLLGNWVSCLALRGQTTCFLPKSNFWPRCDAIFVRSLLRLHLLLKQDEWVASSLLWLLKRQIVMHASQKESWEHNSRNEMSFLLSCSSLLSKLYSVSIQGSQRTFNLIKSDKNLEKSRDFFYSIGLNSRWLFSSLFESCGISWLNKFEREACNFFPQRHRLFFITSLSLKH